MRRIVVLYVNLKELEEILLKDSRIKSVDINLVYPGERVRIVNLMDVVQPRCKIDKVEADFPGFHRKIANRWKWTHPVITRSGCPRLESIYESKILGPPRYVGPGG